MDLLSGIVLAGGESSRMGREKGLVPFRGKPLIRYSLEALSPFCEEIIISANTPEYVSLGYAVVPDEFPGTGPLGGLYSALRRISHNGALVLPCDTPFISREFLRYLLDAVTGRPAVIPVHPGGKAEPLCGYYSKDNIPLMKEYLNKGNYKLTDYLEYAGATFLPLTDDLPFYRPDIFTNLNRPQDLEQYNR